MSVRVRRWHKAADHRPSPQCETGAIFVSCKQRALGNLLGPSASRRIVTPDSSLAGRRMHRKHAGKSVALPFTLIGLRNRRKWTYAALFFNASDKLSLTASKMRLPPLRLAYSEDCPENSPIS